MPEGEYKDVEYMLFCCREMVPTCGFEAKAKTEEEAMKIAKAHAEEAHGMEVSPEMEKKMKEAIKPAKS